MVQREQYIYGWDPDASLCLFNPMRGGGCCVYIIGGDCDILYRIREKVPRDTYL